MNVEDSCFAACYMALKRVDKYGVHCVCIALGLPLPRRPVHGEGLDNSQTTRQGPVLHSVRGFI